MHQTNLVYGYTPQGEPNIKYVGETNVRIGRRVQEHATWDKNSAVYRYSCENEQSVGMQNFKILESGYPKTLDRKIAEALHIKDLSPTLNGQKESYKLKLFN